MIGRNKVGRIVEIIFFIAAVGLLIYVGYFLTIG